MDPIVTAELAVPVPQREPSEAEVASARESLGQLEAEARALHHSAAAAPVHYAMGRIWVEVLGDPKSAATCFQNAFLLNPSYRPNLEAARRLFSTAGRYEKALALHQREAGFLRDPAHRAESLRAQATVLSRDLGKPEEAAALVQEALQLAPEHPALLDAAVQAAEKAGDKLGCVELLLRAGTAMRDDVQKAQLFKRALLMVEELQAESGHADGSPAAPAASAADLEALHEEALRKLYSADPNDPLATLGFLQRSRLANDWDAVLRLCRRRAERTGSPAERALVANIAAHRLGRAAEALAEVKDALEDDRRDGALLALRVELSEAQRSPDLADALRRRADGAIEQSERADLKTCAAALIADPLDREQLLSEALGENPGDAAAIALHARLVALRDPTEASDRFVALGEALQDHAPAEAASHFLEAGAWLERARDREKAVLMARRALALVPDSAAALRLLQRTLPLAGGSAELAQLLEDAAARLPRAQGAEMLVRAAALLSDQPAELDAAEAPQARALELVQRAVEMARGLTTPRYLEAWSTLAYRAGDFSGLSRALEQRADSSPSADAADLFVEAAELSRAVQDDARAAALLRKARAADAQSPAARTSLLALPGLPTDERIELLGEEARLADPARGAALHAERAALLESEGRADEAVQACAQALTLGGIDLAVLRRLARLQVRRGDHAAALAVLLQIAQAVPQGHARAEAYGRAAEVAEWRVGDPRRAIELYQAAAEEWPNARFALAQLGRLLAWTGRAAEAAAVFEKLAQSAELLTERTEARRWAASLHAHRAHGAGRAAELYRALLSEVPGDLEATAALLALLGDDRGAAGRRERAELRGKLASRCQDARVAALLRAQSAEDRLAAGERDQGIAEYRRALALNPQDRIALDRVEEALRASGQRGVLAEHLAFRCAYAEGDTRAALSLQQADLLAEDGQHEKAQAAYQQSLQSDATSLLAVRGARRMAEKLGDKAEQMRLFSLEATLSRDAGAMVEAALLAEQLGERDGAVQHLTSVLEQEPGNAEAARKLRELLGDAAPKELNGIYERVGTAHPDASRAAQAWTQAAGLKLHELGDAPGAFFATGNALARDPSCAGALELRAAAAEATARPREAAEALARLLELAPTGELRLRLGKLYAAQGDAARALPLLGAELDALEPQLLLALASAARGLLPADSTRLYRRLLEAFPAPVEGGASRASIAEWTDELARGYIALGQPDEALAAFKRAVALEPRNRAALRHVADLSGQRAPDEALAAHRALLDMTPPEAESLSALGTLFLSANRPGAALSAASVLVGLGLASPAEKALYEQSMSKPPGAELPQVSDSDGVHAPGDEGPVRELLAAASAELVRALPTELSGRGALVKGDNPVRRVVMAISKALGLGEPQLFLAKSEPAVVLATSTEPFGVLVGSEVPKRFTPRQQRFLYARALAHVRRGTHAVALFGPQKLGALVGELIRLSAPAGTDLSRLPASDTQLGEALARAISPQAREALAPLAVRAAADTKTGWEPLALAMRESAERAAMLLCGDPAAALSVVLGECPGGLDRPEIARLARFAVSESYLEQRKS